MEDSPTRSLLTPLKLAQAYQNAPLDSHDHKHRLLEIAAASLNALGGMLHASFYPEIALKPARYTASGEDVFSPVGRRSFVDFYHLSYREYEQYPFGLLNVVGYWAETQILGGVLIFDRGETGFEVCCPCNPSFTNVYGSLICGLTM